MTNTSRAGLFDADDLSDFTPAPPAASARPEAVRAVAEAAAFRSRGPHTAAPSVTSTPRREPRRHRTGRNVQLNLKVRQDTANSFYALADRLGLVLGEVFERAIEALERELPPR